ncbi:MAG: ABC transporter permease [Chloroflexi bacterium]|nr:ABC transporter permease [Chloroflexota bacterium]
MRPRWRKVLSDLVDNIARTILVVSSIAVGVLAVGVIAGAYVIISNDMSAGYAASHPANIEIRMDDFDDDFLNAIQNFEGIANAEGRRVFGMRVRSVGGTQWTMLNIVAVQDFEEIEINQLTAIGETGALGKNEVIVDRDVLDKVDAQVGDVLEFQLSDGTIKRLQLVGTVRDPATNMDDFLAPPAAYITMSTLPALHQPENYNRVYAIVDSGQDDDTHIRAVATALKDKIEKSGHAVHSTWRSKTHEHPLAATVNAILGILMALGVLIVFLSSSLIANTLSALLNQHLRHIGVMKLVGARDRQIFGMYLALILSFSALALLIAVPLGGQGAYALARYTADEMSFSLQGYRIVPIALVIQIAIGLLVPLVAGFVPIINGSRVTVLKAISGNLVQGTGDQAEGGAKRESRLERLQLRFTQMLNRRGIQIPRPLLISLRNTFRRRGRLALTLFTLTMGGAIFISVFNVRVTLHDYINAIGNYFLADVTLDFDRPYRLNEVKQYAAQVPGVVTVEGWAFANAEILYPDGSTADNMSILAPPAESELVSPILVAGRWLHPDDKKKLAVSDAILDLFPDLRVGDNLTLRINRQDEAWQVVGIFKFVGSQRLLAYAPYEYISLDQNLANRAYSYYIVTERHDRPYQEMMAEKVDAFFRDNGFHLREAKPGLSTLDAAVESLDILVAFLLIMALLTATVGSMGLAGTMSMNVLERTREIGIMRAIGAVDREVMRMVIAEGMLIGLISWVLGALLSIPFTYLLATIVSLAVFSTPIEVIFTPTGFIIWMVLVVILSVLASALPARNAARLTIREVLAYE